MTDLVAVHAIDGYRMEFSKETLWPSQDASRGGALLDGISRGMRLL